MVIASIDIQGGKVVQLKQGAELALERDDAAACAAEFDRYGEVAVIDLDAALGRGTNAAMMKPLLRLADCRVGGGIRTAEQASEWLSLGASKVILGSAAFRLPDGTFGVNHALLQEFKAKIGRERLIVAVDTRSGVITVDGWKTSTGLPLFETARALEPFAGELLWTCVEREGMMAGTDTETARALAAATGAKITAAGGVSTVPEVAELAAAGCDVQLGMALYTGKIALSDGFIAGLDWKKSGGLIPVIAQAADGQVLMTAYTDKEAVAESFARGSLCFHSRSRGRLWMKGESSGNVLRLLRLRADCDRDALLATVEPAGPACHTGAWSCFQTTRRYTMERLQEIISERIANAPVGSYTASLTPERVRRKVMEEAYEVCTAKGRDEVTWEAADLLYHAAVLLAQEGVKIADVFNELDRRTMTPGKTHKK